ncbi:MAG: wax ester/triacylglycerol synthase family O-acyltransferase [Xanthomonadales bacterium]|nr:wax ester/triacylglycerol synthase family O-acyltransferase [Xanthomonadales bacterium]MBP7418286.1 wax ester/triacylglycerol synthase family O-acyltransferase [Xanthomonadales bacterium]HRA37429.1 wax ester/triacylglycerol synthase family O-acyltransferase [Pseudomonadota bacterium]
MATRVSRSLEPMSKVDTAWLRMESPTNLMMITGIMVLDDRLDLARLRKVMAQRFLAYRRFRQKAVETAGGAHWETDPDFDLDWHVCSADLPGKGGKDALQRYVSRLASTPLDPSRPRWQFHVIERYGKGSALVTRMHHCYADGIALVQVLLSLTDAKVSKQQTRDLARAWLREDRGGVVQRLLEPARSGIAQALSLGGKAIEKGREFIADPAVAATLLNEGVQIARELRHMVTLPDDPPTRFRGPLGAAKRVAWAAPMPLEEVKAVGRSLGCTVNDVLMASAVGALRSYLMDLGEDIEGLTIRATVPVNLRPLEHAKKLGNHFGLVYLDLPIGEANPLRRLERVARSMRELKQSRQAIVGFGLLAALGMGPAMLQRPALEMFSRKATAVATNVPGPQMPLYLAGARVADLMFWVPQNGSIGMGISILSYDGNVHFGLMTDARRVPDPGEIIKRFAPEFEKLLLITLMEDWQGEITAADAAATLERFAGHMAEVQGKPARRRRAPSRKPAGAASVATGTRRR